MRQSVGRDPTIAVGWRSPAGMTEMELIGSMKPLVSDLMNDVS